MGVRGNRARNERIERALFLAWSATRRSQGSPRHFCTILTRCPSARRIPCQRSAVIRLPRRVRAGAGVTMRALTHRASNVPPATPRRRRATLRQDARSFDAACSASLHVALRASRSGRSATRHRVEDDMRKATIRFHSPRGRTSSVLHRQGRELWDGAPCRDRALWDA